MDNAQPPQHTSQPASPTDPQFDAQKPMLAEHPQPQSMPKPIVIATLFGIVLIIAAIGWINFFQLHKKKSKSPTPVRTTQPMPTATVAPNTKPSPTIVVPTVTDTATSGESGIDGKIILGPTCPGPDYSGSDCMTPYAATVFIESEDGNVLSQFTSGKDGRFTVHLSPGTYILDPQQPPGASPYTVNKQTVLVKNKAYSYVSIIYDTGIR